MQALRYFIIHIIFTLMESQESPMFNYMLLVKVYAAAAKPWQVKHEINIETCHMGQLN